MQYMGSKARFAKDIVPILQRCIDENNVKLYIEPFVGGANIIDKINCLERIGTDINLYLIKLLIYIRDNDINTIPDVIFIDEYNKVKQSYKNKTNEFPDWYKGLVGFCASYGNKFYNGYARNSQDDTTGQRTKSALKNIKDQKERLKNIKFAVKDYRELAKGNFTNVVLYFDPPYKDTTKYKDSIDYDEFYNLCRKLKSQGNHIFVSEYNMPDDFKCIWTKETKTTIDKNAKNRDTNRIEKLFTL